MLGKGNAIILEKKIPELTFGDFETISNVDVNYKNALYGSSGSSTKISRKPRKC